MKKYDVIGLMSGTSLDGLDIACVRFGWGVKISFELLACKSVSYEPEMKDSLKNSVNLSALALKGLNISFGKYLGKQTRAFIDSYGLTPDLTVSHGHTVFHQPEKGITLQIGDGYEIMNHTGVPTVCDLRSLDVSLGGQGAPLVPFGDKLLFSDYEFCLNLGGFSNISFDQNDTRIAFDICPVNTVLNHLASRLGLEYDAFGQIAKSGITNFSLLEKLNALAYYKQLPPKSLGIEWVQEHIFPILVNDSVENLLHTFCQHIVAQIVSVSEAREASYETQKIPKILVTGGGAKNTFLIELIKARIKNRFDIVVPKEEIIDFKEAIIFALLGVLRFRGEVNTLRSVTGAKRDSSGGVIYDQIIKA